MEIRREVRGVAETTKRYVYFRSDCKEGLPELRVCINVCAIVYEKRHGDEGLHF